jgi:hypothetical protein
MGKQSERFWKRVNAYEKDETKDRISHSTSYHSYFQGYSEHKIPKKNGKGYRIERIYTADYCKYQETDASWRLKKVLYLALLVGAIAALILGGTSRSVINCTRFTGVAQILAWIPMAYLGYSMIAQLQASRLMTIGDYRAASTHLEGGALVTGSYLAAVCVSMFAVKLLSSSSFCRDDVLALAGELTGTVLILLIFWQEHTREIQWVRNQTSVPYDANEIW